MTEGYLNLVLHAHLPFVRHTDRADRLEERWLFEALTETYIPLLQVFSHLVQEQIDFRITVSLSPPLISMLADKLLQTRYRNYLDTLSTLAVAEVERTEGDPLFHASALEYQRRFKSIRHFFDRCEGNILTEFAQLEQIGKVELITSAATHAFLPYIKTDAALYAQIATAVSVFESHFYHRPTGIWLPECAYTPRVNRFLLEFGIRYFFVDTHAFAAASPEPVFSSYAPIVTSHGIAAFARDEECSRQVWSSETGYPGDYDYREYYRDIGYDLDEAYIRPFIHPEGIRINTGFKYFRITGDDAEKQPYDFQRARDKAAEHAGNFLYNHQRQAEHVHHSMGRVPIITAPYDAELFGHWWYEGPVFLDLLLRKIHYDQSQIATITPSDYLNHYSDFQSCELFFSTWGRDGYGDVWLNTNNDWLYPALHDCEERMRHLANSYNLPGPPVLRALNQSARELMLAQSSDWAFIMDTKTAVDYAVRRTKHHINRFRALADMIEAGSIDEHYLSELEAIDNLFPEVNYQLYHTAGVGPSTVVRDDSPRVRILMLSWEFPPMSVGGLSRHVYDLSRHLTAIGCEVHVVTTAVQGYPLDEVVQGVHVHRVQVLQPDGGGFIHFVLQLNLAILERCRRLVDRESIPFDVIHAHDWLVAQAAKALKQKVQLPLVATIHATEHGRNQGIFTDTQRHIHHQEWVLTYEAERVIVCSSYMWDEVASLFELPQHKLQLLPNGVDEAVLTSSLTSVGDDIEPYEYPSEQMILFVGRLVREKGVHLLLEAAPAIRAEFPGARFVIVGKGPMSDELVNRAAQLGLSEHITFTGYADDDKRNRLLHAAEVAVFPSLYEPFGIVALEAMAAGTPVVVSDVGGLRDIVTHNHNGLKVYPDDAQSIAGQVMRILRNCNLAQQLRQTAKAELRRFDWHTIATGTRAVYEQVRISKNPVF